MSKTNKKKHKKKTSKKKSVKSKSKVIVISESESNNEDVITVYTDGSCSRNGKAGSLGGIGIYFPNGELESISKVYPSSTCTNQKAELYAIYLALYNIKKYLDIDNNRVVIKTDSEYSINCLTRWVEGWIKRNWIKTDGKPVLNKKLIYNIYKYVKKYDVVFIHVRSHTNGTDKDSMGNAEADRLATSATASAMEKKRSDNIDKTTPKKSSRKEYDNKSKNTNGSKTNKKRNNNQHGNNPRYNNQNSYNPRYGNNPRYNNGPDASDLVVELV